MKKFILLILPIYRLIYSFISNIKLESYMLIQKLKFGSIGDNTRMYRVNVTEPYNVYIGHHVYINTGCDLITTGSKIEIGNYVMLGPNVTLVAQNHDASDLSRPMIINKRYIKGNIKIEDDVWIGANATILANVNVGRGAIVGAGAVVTKDVLPYSIVGGVPAKMIKKRSTENQIKKAMRQSLENFEKIKIDWNTWAVGDVVKYEKNN